MCAASAGMNNSSFYVGRACCDDDVAPHALYPAQHTATAAAGGGVCWLPNTCTIMGTGLHTSLWEIREHDRVNG